MNKIIPIFIVFVLLLQLFSKMFVFCSYLSNKEYIAKTLCENRAKPKLKCNGKCYLAKQLKSSEKKEASIPGGVKEKIEVISFLSANALFQDQRPITDIKFIPYTEAYSYIVLSDIFHPPLFI